MSHTALKTLLMSLAVLFRQEGRAGDNAAAAALQAAVGEVNSDLQKLPNPYDGTLRAGLTQNPQPIVAEILSAMSLIQWGAADLRKGRVPDDLAEAMPMCELVGPDGMFPNEHARVGLWLQTPNIVYGPRAHAAEETFLLLAGEAQWSVNETEPVRKVSGESVFHRSNIPHKSVTEANPVFAAWRWSGEIGFDKYELIG